MIILQAEIAKDLLTATDLTIAGILLSVIALLIYEKVRLDKQVKELNKYVREQEVSTLKIMLDFGNLLKSNQETSKEVKESVSSIDNTVNDNNSVLKNLITMIQNKLLNMK